MITVVLTPIGYTYFYEMTLGFLKLLLMNLRNLFCWTLLICESAEDDELGYLS